MLSFYTSPVFNLPAGPKNLSALIPVIDWYNVDHYYVELKDNTEAVLLRTPDYILGCCCDEDKVRIHFRNSLGGFDAVNFMPPKIVRDVQSTESRKSLTTPLQKTDAAMERFNIRANVVYEAMTACYDEPDMPWLMELAQTGKGFMEWKGTQGQSDSYLAVSILDGKYEQKKNDEQFYYPFRITFKLSNDIILQR
jgi:hypothetical protein